MAILKSENWDSVASPSIPAGWTVDAVFTTDSPIAPVTPISNPNTLYLTPDGTTDNFFATWGTPDGSGGDVSVQASFNANTSTGVTLYGVAARGSATPLDFSSVSYYRGTLNLASGTINIDKVVSGIVTNLSSLPFGPGFLFPQVWYQIILTISGTTLSIAAQRLSDNNWVHKVGVTAVFQPGQVVADSIIDGSITGSGYSGINCRQSGGASDPVYSDDFLFESIGTGTPIQYTQKQTFDDVIAPALPTGFTFDAPLVTTATFAIGILPITPPNALILDATGVNTAFAATSATTDTSNGDVSVMCYANSPQTTGNQIAGLMARGNTYPIDPLADSFVWFELDFFNTEARLSVVTLGGVSVLDSVVLSELIIPGWYLMSLQVEGIDIQAFLQRQSDMFWLDSSGNWVATYQPAIVGNDSSLVGSGYVGMTLVSNADILYVDSFQANSAISKTLAAPFYDRVFESGNASGITDVLLFGHFSSYQDFSIIGDGNPTGYCISDQINDEFEIGFGTYHSSGPSLSRNTVAASSNSNMLVNFQYGPKDVFTSISARYIKRTTATLFDHFTNVSNVSTGETDLYSDSLPGDTLQFDGDKITASYAVELLSSASTKRCRIYFSGTSILDTGALTTSGSATVLISVTIIRDSSNSVRYSALVTIANASPTSAQSVGSLSGLTLTSPITLKLTGQAAGGAAASGDITSKFSTVSIVPSA